MPTGLPQRGGRGMITGINMTPLVDIALVLLIIFMVTASYIVAMTIKVELPQAQTGEETPTTMIALSITREGRVFLNGERVSDRQLLGKVRDLVQAEHGEVQAVISADRAATHGRVIYFVDLLKQLGISRFAINIEQPR